MDARYPAAPTKPAGGVLAHSSLPHRVRSTPWKANAAPSEASGLSSARSMACSGKAPGAASGTSVCIWVVEQSVVSAALPRSRRGHAQRCLLTPGEAAVLEDVIKHPASTISQIHQRTGFAQSHVTTSVARLKARKLVEATTDPEDGRRARVHVTDAAMQAIAPAQPAISSRSSATQSLTALRHAEPPHCWTSWPTSCCKPGSHRTTAPSRGFRWQTGQKWLERFMNCSRTIRVPQRSHDSPSRP